MTECLESAAVVRPQPSLDLLLNNRGVTVGKPDMRGKVVHPHFPPVCEDCPHDIVQLVRYEELGSPLTLTAIIAAVGPLLFWIPEHTPQDLLIRSSRGLSRAWCTLHGFGPKRATGRRLRACTERRPDRESKRRLQSEFRKPAAFLYSQDACMHPCTYAHAHTYAHVWCAPHLLCCSAAPLLCCSAAVLLRCRAALLLCCSAAVLLGCTPGGAYICGALLSCCAALLLCCSTAVLLCCRAAALPWCAPQDSLLPMPHKLSIRCQNASSALKRRVSGSMALCTRIRTYICACAKPCLRIP